MRDLRRQARGPRVVNGEKRSETVKASITFSELQRTEAAASVCGMSRALYVATAIQALNDMVEAGAVPTGAMEHWQQIARGAQTTLLSARNAIDGQIAALGLICIAAGAEIADAELTAEAQAERRAA